jgi:hypothetical protein
MTEEQRLAALPGCRVKFRELIDSKGYPQDSMLEDCPFYIPKLIGGQFQLAHIFEAAIVDPITCQLLAIIEYKINAPDANSARAAYKKYRSLSNYARHLFPVFAVFPEEDGNAGLRSLIDPSKWQELKWNAFPLYTTLRAHEGAKRFLRIQVQRKRFIVGIYSAALLLALLLAAVLVYRFHSMQEFKTDELALMGAIIGLFLLPFAASMKILGVEIQPKENRKENI